VKKSLGVNHVK